MTGVAAPARIERETWLALAVIIAASLLISLDSTIVNLALPAVVSAFPGRSVDWVVTSYLIGLGLAQPGAAWLIDRFGGRRTMIGSLSLFLVAAACAGAAPGFSWLVGFRFAQGVAGGALIPVSLALITHAFPAERRASVVGLWSMVSMIAPALGPLVGGYLLTHASWRWAFWINVPIAAISLAGAVAFMRDYAPTRPARLDALGWALASVGLLAMLIAFSRADRWHWISARTLGLLALAAVMFGALALWATRTPNPVVDFASFRMPGFLSTMCLIGVGSIGYTSRLVFIPLQLSSLRGLDPLEIGWLLLPAAGALMVSSLLSGRWHDRRGPRGPIFLGGLLVIASSLLLGRLTLTTPTWWIAVVMIGQAVGSGLIIMPATVAALDALPPHMAGQVAVVRAVFRQVAAAFGIAVLSTLLRSRIDGRSDEPAHVQQAYNAVFLAMIALGVVAVALFRRVPERKRN